jgi:hypothetical protein
MRKILTIVGVIWAGLFLYCNGGEGSNHPQRPPGADSSGKDTFKTDTQINTQKNVDTSVIKK